MALYRRPMGSQKNDKNPPSNTSIDFDAYKKNLLTFRNQGAAELAKELALEEALKPIDKEDTWGIKKAIFWHKFSTIGSSKKLNDQIIKAEIQVTNDLRDVFADMDYFPLSTDKGPNELKKRNELKYITAQLDSLFDKMPKNPDPSSTEDKKLDAANPSKTNIQTPAKSTSASNAKDPSKTNIQTPAKSTSANVGKQRVSMGEKKAGTNTITTPIEQKNQEKKQAAYKMALARMVHEFCIEQNLFPADGKNIVITELEKLHESASIKTSNDIYRTLRLWMKKKEPVSSGSTEEEKKQQALEHEFKMKTTFEKYHRNYSYIAHMPAYKDIENQLDFEEDKKGDISVKSRFGKTLWSKVKATAGNIFAGATIKTAATLAFGSPIAIPAIIGSAGAMAAFRYHSVKKKETEKQMNSKEFSKAFLLNMVDYFKGRNDPLSEEYMKLLTDHYPVYDTKIILDRINTTEDLDELKLLYSALDAIEHQDRVQGYFIQTTIQLLKKNVSNRMLDITDLKGAIEDQESNFYENKLVSPETILQTNISALLQKFPKDITNYGYHGNINAYTQADIDAKAKASALWGGIGSLGGAVLSHLFYPGVGGGTKTASLYEGPAGVTHNTANAIKEVIAQTPPSQGSEHIISTSFTGTDAGGMGGPSGSFDAGGGGGGGGGMESVADVGNINVSDPNLFNAQDFSTPEQSKEFVDAMKQAQQELQFDRNASGIRQTTAWISDHLPSDMFRMEPGSWSEMIGTFSPAKTMLHFTSEAWAGFAKHDPNFMQYADFPTGFNLLKSMFGNTFKDTLDGVPPEALNPIESNLQRMYKDFPKQAFYILSFLTVYAAGRNAYKWPKEVEKKVLSVVESVTKNPKALYTTGAIIDPISTLCVYLGIKVGKPTVFAAMKKSATILDGFFKKAPKDTAA